MPSRTLRRATAVSTLAALVGVGALALPAHAASSTCDADSCTVAFDALGAPETWTVPDGVEELELLVAGGAGASTSRSGGPGGVVATTVAVDPGDVLTVAVGGRGTAAGTFGGGGAAPGGGLGAGGGGGSFVYLDGVLLVAAGGGGGGGAGGGSGDGGAGGGSANGLVGGTADGGAYGGGGGGTPTGPGTPNTNSVAGGAGTGPATGPTTPGRGGAGTGSGGGGGGGGYFGGAGGSENQGPWTLGGGGGGGGYLLAGLPLETPATPFNGGAGRVTVSYALTATTTSLALGATRVVPGATVTAHVTSDAVGEPGTQGRLVVDGTPLAPFALVEDPDRPGTTAATFVAPATFGQYTVVAETLQTGTWAGSASSGTDLLVAPASLDLDVTYADGSPVSGELTSGELRARAAGQYPGAPVEVTVGDEPGLTVTGTVASDGTVDLPVDLTDPLVAGPTTITMTVRLPDASSLVDSVDVVVPTPTTRTTLTLATTVVRAGQPVGATLSLAVLFYGEVVAEAPAEVLATMVADGDLVLTVDGAPLDPASITVTDPEPGTSQVEITFPAPTAIGTRTVVARFDGAPDGAGASSSAPQTLVVAPTGFTVELRGAGGAALPADGLLPGRTVEVTVRGLLPGTTARVELSPGSVLLGTLTVGADGAATGSWTVPAGTQPGAYRVVVTATDTRGATLVADAALTVRAAATGAPAGLSTTGAEPAPLLGVALLLVVVGAATLHLTRRRSALSPR